MARGKRVILAAAGMVLMFVLMTPAEATFPGANGRITFHRFLEDKNGVEIFSAAPNGTDQQQLTDSGEDRSAALSDWSPNGLQIAFDSDRVDKDGLEDVVQVYVMPWNGEAHGLKQLTVGEGFHGDPAWSPSGSNIAIESDWGNYPADQGIWIIPSSDADGVTKSEATRVTSTPGANTFDSEPQFSPNGQWIVFTRFKDCKFVEHGHVMPLAGCHQAIFKVRVDGSGLTRLTGWGTENSSPDWSPSGNRITFDSGDVGQMGSKGDVWTMNADGSNKRRLTNNPPVSNAGQSFGNFRFPLGNNPVWSPSGTKILYSQWDASGFPVSLVSINPDGSGRTTVVGGEFFQNKADWGTHP
jgi:TolB protein